MPSNSEYEIENNDHHRTLRQSVNTLQLNISTFFWEIRGNSTSKLCRICYDDAKRRRLRRLKIVHTGLAIKFATEQRKSAIGVGHTAERVMKETRNALATKKESSSYLVGDVHSDLIFCLSSYRRRWRVAALGAQLHRLGTRRRGVRAVWWRSSHELPIWLRACAYTPPPDNGLGRCEGASSSASVDAGIAAPASLRPIPGCSYATAWLTDWAARFIETELLFNTDTRR